MTEQDDPHQAKDINHQQESLSAGDLKAGDRGKSKLRLLDMDHPDRGVQRGLSIGAYTKLVRFLRLALPLAALAIIALLFSWPQMQDVGISAVTNSDMSDQKIARNELLKPRFESRDNKNQPYTITADSAVQSDQDPDVVILEKPMADITLTDGTWLAMEALRGAYKQDVERLLLEGKVKLFHDDGYEMVTEKMMVNVKEQVASSDVDIYGQGPVGNIRATGVDANAQDGTLIFKGPVRLILNKRVEGL